MKTQNSMNILTVVQIKGMLRGTMPYCCCCLYQRCVDVDVDVAVVPDFGILNGMNNDNW